MLFINPKVTFSNHNNINFQFFPNKKIVMLRAKNKHGKNSKQKVCDAKMNFPIN